MIQRSLVYVALMIILFASSGCGQNIFEGLVDDKTTASKLEAAKIALDTGDYDQAVSVLEGLCGTDLNNPTCSVEAQTALASAYMVQETGLDVLQLINKAEQATSTAGDTYTNVSSLLPISKIQACADNPTAPCPVQDSLDKAITLLENLLPTTVPASPTREESNLYLQLAIASATDVAITVGILSGGLDANGVPINVPTGLDSAGQDRLSNDINNVAEGVQGSGIGGESLAQNIQDFRTKLDSNGDNSVGLSELQCYTQQTQGTACP